VPAAGADDRGVPAPTADDLSTVPLLSGLPDSTRAALAERFEVEEYAAGATVVAEGRAGYAFYVVARGFAAVLQEGRHLRRLGPGDYFGEISIMGDGHRTATVAAATPLVVWVLFGTVFRTLQTGEPEVAAALQEAMQARLAAD
jgi:CRP-like cAMP-binding protein